MEDQFMVSWFRREMHNREGMTRLVSAKVESFTPSALADAKED